jgi:hypothetical protein
MDGGDCFCHVSINEVGGVGGILLDCLLTMLTTGVLKWSEADFIPPLLPFVTGVRG